VTEGGHCAFRSASAWSHKPIRYQHPCEGAPTGAVPPASLVKLKLFAMLFYPAFCRALWTLSVERARFMNDCHGHASLTHIAGVACGLPREQKFFVCQPRAAFQGSLRTAGTIAFIQSA
jgi:hypothetical protein